MKTQVIRVIACTVLLFLLLAGTILLIFKIFWKQECKDFDFCKTGNITETLAPELFLYKRNKPPIPLHNTQPSNYSELITPGVPLVIGVHGFMNSKDSPFGTDLRTVLRGLSPEVNVVLVNWKTLAYPNGLTVLKYQCVVSCLEVVGQHIANFINQLVSNNITEMANIHYIGHSLGAHIANFVARHIQSNKKMGRITGLDPAHPNFAKGLERLDPADADFVDVIHTGMSAEIYQLGHSDRLGHVDFFPNGGLYQPGCWLVTCDHSQAYMYYIESIRRPENFVASKCFNWDSFLRGECASNENLVMGWKINNSNSIEGDFYLETASREPFGYGPSGAAPSGRIKAKTTFKKVLRACATTEMLLLFVCFLLVVVVVFKACLKQAFIKCWNAFRGVEDVKAENEVPLVENITQVTQ